ncbi:hypothetical protein BDFB_002054 [Asbolus verrucosus]|uniref:Uncharacterized protein n=1 Tax=Asbolus verrucosus TaxID=1661398 RepID=A0A482V820_ASBVE|nr:hypothetical protein BDFB_002054 [Asbolus verrucosus]
MSKQQHLFDDNTLLSTPNPIHSSSMSVDKEKRKISPSGDPFRGLTDAKNSFGANADSRESLMRSAEQLKRERLLAANTLNRMDSLDSKMQQATNTPNQIESIPSRFLKRSELSASSSPIFVHSESTISESDLLFPGNSSTPRESLLSNMEFVMKEPSRVSRAQSISRLADAIMDTDCDMSKLMETFQKTMDTDLGSFCSGEEALEQFEQDEMSWKKEKDFPGQVREFSVGRNSQLKLSMGSFFKERSDDLSKVLARSPKKIQPPMPLIETSMSDCVRDITVNEMDDSLSISIIAKILSDTKQTPHRAMDYLMNPKKKSQSSTFRRSSTFDDREETRKSRSSAVKKSPTLELYGIEEEFKNTAEEETRKSRGSAFRKSPTPESNEEEEECRKDTKEEARKSGGSPFTKSPTSEWYDREEAAKDNVNAQNMKENISPNFHHDKSALSSRSSSSLSSLPNGKLPIATTRTEIIWGCIKPGKNASQDFVIKNKSSSRVGVKCSVSNPSFRLIKECSDMNFSSTMKVILHPYESRTLTVTFAPTTLGAAVDHLDFIPIDPSQKQTVKQFVKLFGYGGHGSVTINDIIKDTSGKFLLTLGNIDHKETMKRTFTIRNNGTLPSFAYIGFISNGLYLFSNVKISPQALVLLPEIEREVVVTYDPKKEDINFIQSKLNCCVVDMGKLTVLHGTEADRGRLRKLCKKAKEMGVEINPAIENLVGKFPGEVMPNDLKQMKEPIASMDEILRLVNTQEVIVTLEQDLDRSLTEQLQNETAMFHSLCENTNPEMFDNTIRSDTCSVEPSKIILTPPEKISDRIFLSNHSKKKLYFEIHSAPEGLRFKPKDGTVGAGETSVVQLVYTKACNGKSVFKVRILVDSEAFEVDVKVVFIRHKTE